MGHCRAQILWAVVGNSLYLAVVVHNLYGLLNCLVFIWTSEVPVCMWAVIV